jgi:hypothetical protein
MRDPQSSIPFRNSRVKRVARRVLEIITAIALVLAALYWPSTNAGRLYLVALVVVLFVGVSLFRKWPSV